MSRYVRSVMFAGLSILWCGVSASAETLRCQSVNGNLNCAGSSGTSCQTIDGKTVCSSGHGDVVQTFGNGHSSDSSNFAAQGSNFQGHRNLASGSTIKERLEQYHRQRRELLEQDETRSGLHADGLSLDRD